MKALKKSAAGMEYSDVVMATVFLVKMKSSS